MNKWIGVDLDGTLATYRGWRGVGHIGAPIPRMTFRVKRWLAEGKTVKIFTARVADKKTRVEAVRVIQAWTREHLGATLEVTNEKDQGLTEIWDDRAYGIRKNWGTRRR